MGLRLPLSLRINSSLWHGARAERSFHLPQALTKLSYMNILRRVCVFLNLRPVLEDEQLVVDEITQGVSFRGANLWILIFAIFTASLGLNVNSTAVIIGAMLISPLMGPIIGMGLAVGINDPDLLRRAAKNFSIATLISVLTAMVYFLISPLGEAQSELLARTSPTIYDVLIAFFGGAAGIVALATRGGKSGNVLPGVAIATALMPPLCTAGYGLATGQLLYFLGAIYLFFINTVFIALATIIAVRLMRFTPHSFLTPERAKRARHMLTLIVIATALPALWMTADIVRSSITAANLRSFVKGELTQSGTQILSSDLDRGERTLRIVAVGRELSEQMQQEAAARLSDYGLSGYQLSVIQGVQSDSILALSSQLEQRLSVQEQQRQQLLQLTQEHALLTDRLAGYMRYEELSRQLQPELRALFPGVQHLALAPVAEPEGDSTLRYVVGLLSLEESKALTAADRERLEAWLRTRLGGDSLLLVQRPAPRGRPVP